MNIALSQNSPHVKNLAAHGVSVRDLTPKSFWDHRWSLRVTIPPAMEKTVLKRHVQHFLEVEFEASEFEWYRSKDAPDRVAIVHFKSFAL